MIAYVFTILISAIAFGAFSFAGLLIARTYFGGAPLPGGPPPGVPPTRILIVACGLVGAICGYRGLGPEALAIIALACALMTAIWCVDVTRGFIPDALTLAPLAVLVIAGLLTGRWFMAVAAAVPAAPFAFMAWRTKGIGMGWGDVKLAALGGALLGMRDAMLAFAIASVIAIVIAKVRRTGAQPVAFGPYLASAIVVPLCLRTGLS